jgi:hypothetical protein
MQTIKAILVIVLIVSMLAGLVCGVLALTVGKPPDALGRICGGAAALAVGLLILSEAVSKSGSPARWRGSDVQVGRLSSFALGIGACALGVVFLGGEFLPERYLLWLGIVFAASFPLALLGQKIDGFVHARTARQGRPASPPSSPEVGEARSARPASSGQDASQRQ